MYKFDLKNIKYINDISANNSTDHPIEKYVMQGIKHDKQISIYYLDAKGKEFRFSERKETLPNKNINEKNDLYILDSKNLISLRETQWSIDCEPYKRNIMFRDDKTIIISMETNQYYITLQEKSRKGNVRFYQYKEMSGLGSVDYNSEFFNNAETVCSIEVVNENTLKLNWLGFYDKQSGKRLQNKNPLAEEKEMVELKKCE